MRIKKAKYLLICPLAKNKFLLENIVTGNQIILDSEQLKLIEFFDVPKLPFQIKNKFKNLSYKNCNAFINKLIKNNILISNKNRYANSFKEKFLVVGFGDYQIFNRISLEAYTILKNCNKIIHIFSDDFSNTLKNINENIFNLNEYFLKQESENGSTYALKKVAEKYIELALKENDTVYLIFGNPFVGEIVPKFINEIAEQMGLSVKFIPGQSSLNWIPIELKFDPFLENISIVSPPFLNSVLNSDTPILLVLTGYSGDKIFGISNQNFEKNLSMQLNEIKNILLRKFPYSHKIYFINFKGVFRFILGEMENSTRIWARGQTSIFIPSLHS